MEQEHVGRLKPPECWKVVWKKNPYFKNAKDPKDMSPEEIKKEMVELLFSEEFRKKIGARDRELLTIVILQEKAHYFDFLKGYTSWKTVGKWEKLVEHNLQIDIEFFDTEDEAVGNRLMDLLYEYNNKVVKEDMLYARTAPLEEGTLQPE